MGSKQDRREALRARLSECEAEADSLGLDTVGFLIAMARAEIGEQPEQKS